jgi:acetyl esterase/lipase
MQRPLAIFFVLAAALAAPAQEKPPQTAVPRTEDVVYGRKFGTALTLDVFQPAKPNGVGIIVMVSGGWVSSHDWLGSLFQPWIAGLTDHGYTVFGVCHACQPKFAVPEILGDVNRAVRFIRRNASKYGVDPNRLGVTGVSAGGHLSLMLGAAGQAGRANASDPVERESSAVQCVACFAPPSDFLNYGKPGEDAVGVGRLKNFRPAFGLTGDSAEERQKRGHEISPIYFVTSSTAPTLIIHGDKDPLVPIQQAEIFIKRCEEAHVPSRLIVKPGKGHGWNFAEDMPAVIQWFDEHLPAKAAPSPKSSASP